MRQQHGCCSTAQQEQAPCQPGQHIPTAGSMGGTPASLVDGVVPPHIQDAAQQATQHCALQPKRSKDWVLGLGRPKPYTLSNRTHAHAVQNCMALGCLATPAALHLGCISTAVALTPWQSARPRQPLSPPATHCIPVSCCAYILATTSWQQTRSRTHRLTLSWGCSVSAPPNRHAEDSKQVRQHHTRPKQCVTVTFIKTQQSVAPTSIHTVYIHICCAYVYGRLCTSNLFPDNICCLAMHAGTDSGPYLTGNLWHKRGIVR
jgi:hypothetical protein